MTTLSFLDRLDDDHRGIVETIPDGVLDLSALDAMRQRTDALLVAAAARQQPRAGVRIEECIIPGSPERPDLTVRLYIRDDLDSPGPVFLYIHGGGYVSTRAAHYDAQCAQIADEARLLVASIDYRLAPEHPYPVPLEDCYAALAWLYHVAGERWFDRDRIGVGGTSAGAGLAAALCLLARDRGEYSVAFQYLEAPMVDHRNVTPSSQGIDSPRVWHRAANEIAWTCYLGPDHLERPVPPYASPALADDLSGLPPTYLCVAAHDLFLDETIDYARRLLHAGVSVQFNLFEMGFHGSPRLLPSAPVSVRWKADSIAALRRLSGTPLAHPKHRISR